MTPLVPGSTMSRSLLLLVALVAAPAFAQTPAPAEAPAAAVVAAAPESAWLTVDVTSVRFKGERTPGPAFRKGTEVTVLVRDGDQVRVASGDHFGWVEATKLAAAPPAAEAEALPEAP